MGTRVSVRLPELMVSAIDSRARRAGTSRAEMIRRLLDEALATADGVDRAQIARRLQMTPAERVRTMAEEARRLLALAERAGRARRKPGGDG
ncbi:MAG: hypothetical protein KatS3mg008_2255 [Acidimicrobiales bacterium]|nr:MAG: hypothetical protein KatS3mg008_2255 [Acidimicrobiales bacterium]